VTTTASSLVLGWAVNKSLDPSYWVAGTPVPGRQASSDMVVVPAPLIARHIAIVAQSGSGKSFFLGRLIEEILIKTKSRVLVLDPNSDFRKINELVSNDFWKSGKYDAADRSGFLPDEETIGPFDEKWKQVSKAVYSANRLRINPSERPSIKPLEIDWTTISTEVLAGELNPLLEDELRRCHAFVRTISRLMDLTKDAAWHRQNHLLDVTKAISDEMSQQNPEQRALTIRHHFPFKQGIVQDESSSDSSDLLERAVGLLHRQVVIHREYISEAIERFYFSNAFGIRFEGLLREQNTLRSTQARERLQVIDLPSISEARYRPWVTSTLIEVEWLEARRRWEKAIGSGGEDDRVPTFIVLDEAHNLVPLEPRNSAERGLREQFRRIAAEGRKFGVFLILVSQRPDKLDSFVVSECEDKAVMRLGSETVLAKTREVLGLGEVPERMLERCLEFDTGRALLAGAWVNNTPLFLYGCARRTLEGGKNLKDSYWAVS
jgi:Helicase HerA, central domain